MNAALEAIGLTKRYRKTWALRDCDLVLPSGSVIGLVGPNGAGKTTLLQLAVGLQRRGVGVITAQEDGTATLPDSKLLDRSTALECALFTQDEDLLAEAKLRQIAGITFMGVIYGHQQKVTVGQCVDDLELICLTSEPGDLANKVEYLPLK